MARHVHGRPGCDSLCLAGGVALNCVGNGGSLRRGAVRALWIQPAAGRRGRCARRRAVDVAPDSSGSRASRRSGDAMHGAFLGSEIATASPADRRDPGVGSAPVWDACDERRAPRGASRARSWRTARSSGWFAGAWSSARARSARDRSSATHDCRRCSRTMNLKIKFRECFRPSPRSCSRGRARLLRHHARESVHAARLARHRATAGSRASRPSGLFGIDLLKASRSEIPAVTHVDHSARVQTVDAERNPF